MLAAKCAASLDRPAGGCKRCLAVRRRRCRAGRARARSLAWPFLCEDARRLVLSQIEEPRHGLPPGVEVGFPPPDAHRRGDLDIPTRHAVDRALPKRPRDYIAVPPDTPRLYARRSGPKPPGNLLH